MNTKLALENLIYIFYALAVLSAVAIVAPLKWPKSSVPLAIVVVLLGAVTLGSGCYIAYAGGKIRHREFRNEPRAADKIAKHEYDCCEVVGQALRLPVFGGQAKRMPYNLARDQRTRSRRTRR